MSIESEKYNIKFINYEKNNESLKFDVINCNSSFINALRRIIISHVKSISFDTTDYENSDLKVIENTSSYHNEFLLHRFGLIPIYGNLEMYDTSLYTFSLNIENTTNDKLHITTKDISDIWPKDNKCPVLNINFEMGYKNKKTKSYAPSLDRIEPKKGYVKGNILVVCDIVNRLKSDASIEDLRKISNFFINLKKIKI